MPAATANPKAAEAGKKFATLRTQHGWKQSDVEKESLKRWGEGGVIRIAQLSRIEKGGYDRVSLDDAVRLGELYGLTPEEVSEMYGLYRPTEAHDIPDDVRYLLSMLPSLPFDIRERLLFAVRTAAVMAKHDANVREGRDDSDGQPKRKK